MQVVNLQVQYMYRSFNYKFSTCKYTYKSFKYMYKWSNCKFMENSYKFKYMYKMSSCIIKDLDGAGDVVPVHPDHGVEGGVGGDVAQGLCVLGLPALPRLVLQHIGVSAPQRHALEAVVRGAIEQILVGVLRCSVVLRWI